MKFSVSIAMSPPDQLVELARTAEECGFDAIALPDSIFFSEAVSAAYPYTADGSRMWDADTPWVDPMVAAGAMGAVTDRIRFYVSVLKMGMRHPVLLARQVGSVAALTGDRFGLGLGLGWLPEEFEWCGAEFAHRGRRVEEAIEVLRLILGGGMVEHHGEFYDFGRLQMSPAPARPVPIYIGGHTPAGLARAARVGDGWSSAMMTFDHLQDTIAELRRLLKEHGRDDAPFEIQAVCTDRFGVDGYRAQQDIGVTDVITIPWLFYGVGHNGSVVEKQDGLRRFADEIIARF